MTFLGSLYDSSEKPVMIKIIMIGENSNIWKKYDKIMGEKIERKMY